MGQHPPRETVQLCKGEWWIWSSEQLVQRSCISKQMWTKSARITIKVYLIDQNAIEPSSAPPTIYFSLVRGFWTRWRPPIDPLRGGLDVLSAVDVSKASLSEFFTIWGTKNWRIRPSARKWKTTNQPKNQVNPHNPQYPWMTESSSKGKAEVSNILNGLSKSSLFVCQTTCEAEFLPFGSMFSLMGKATTCSWQPPSNRVIKISLWPENVMQSCWPMSRTHVSSGLFEKYTQ